MALFTVPLALTAFATSPFVADIHVWLPKAARQSREALHQFARSTPADTKIEFTKIGFLPFPRRRAAYFSTLYALRPKRFRLATIEQIPRANQGKETPSWLHAQLGHLYVKPGNTWTKGSRAPGVWQMLHEQIRRNDRQSATRANKQHEAARPSTSLRVPTSRAVPRSPRK